MKLKELKVRQNPDQQKLLEPEIKEQEFAVKNGDKQIGEEGEMNMDGGGGAFCIKLEFEF